jgi:hypothetical protein
MPNAAATTASTHDDRVTRVEVAVGELRSNVENITNAVGDLTAAATRTQSEVSHLAKLIKEDRDNAKSDREKLFAELSRQTAKQYEMQRTNWPVLLSFAGVTLTLIVTIGGVLAYAIREPSLLRDELHDREIRRAAERLDRINDRLAEIRYHDGVVDTKLDALTRKP